MILYPPIDLALLASAFAVTLMLGCHDLTARQIKQEWMANAPVWIGMPFLFMFLGKAYERVWGRARISEYFLFAISILAGIGGAGAIALLQTKAGPDVLLTMVLYAGVATPLLAGIRAFPRAVQDAMSASRRHRPHGRRASRRVIVYGAGYRCTLFLRELSFHETGAVGMPEVVALLDDDPNLHGRLVHGLRVLGGRERLRGDFLQREKIDEIVVAASLRSDIMQTLLELARKAGVAVLEWRTELKPAESALSNNESPPTGEQETTR